jgi:hypothetical protein
VRSGLNGRLDAAFTDVVLLYLNNIMNRFQLDQLVEYLVQFSFDKLVNECQTKAD